MSQSLLLSAGTCRAAAGGVMAVPRSDTSQGDVNIVFEFLPSEASRRELFLFQYENRSQAGSA